MKIKNVILLSILSVFISGCGLTYKVLLGVDMSHEWNTEKQIIKQSEKYNIPAAYNLVLDTASYKKEVKDLYSVAIEGLEISHGDSSHLKMLKKARNDDLQPVQFRLFDQKGSEIFKLVNCYVDFPINWNVEGCFDTFPPVTAFETLNIHMFTLEFLLSHSKTIGQQSFSYADLPKADYYGVIFWNNSYKRPSKRLIKTVREYRDENDKSISLIYINNQNQFLWSLLTSDLKENLKKEIQENKL